MNIWLDDVRHPAPYGRLGWKWVKTGEDFIELMRKGDNIDWASLDHDLSWDHYPVNGKEQHAENTPMSGTDVVEKMIEENLWPNKGIIVHSMNPAGADRMMRALVAAAPECLGIQRIVAKLENGF
jgi:hypothetical protein